MASLFPGALDTTASLFTAVNGLQTTLTGFHSSSAAILNVKDTTGAPASGYATVDGEAILYTAKTPTSLTGCTRHADGTAPSTHNDKAVVKFGLVADHHNSVVQAIIAIEAKIGSGANFPSATITASIAAASITPDKISNPSKARWTNTATQAILATTPTKVTFAANSYTDGNFAASRYTATVAGKYAVKAVVPFVANGAARRLIVMLYKNGAEYGRTGANSVVGQYVNVPFADDVSLAVTDYLELFVWSSVADTIGFGGGDTAAIAIALMP